MNSIYEQHNLPREVIRAIVDDCFMLISFALVDGCRVRIENFGSLKLIHSRSHLGPCSKISFRTGRQFKVMANEARRKLR